MNYDAVLFDNDGVLVGRTAYDVLHEAAWEAFDAVGVGDPDPADVESIVVGVDPEDVDAVARTYGVDPEALWAARDRTASAAQEVEARAGRKTPYEDLAVLEDIDLPMGVVSSNQQTTVDFLLDHFGLGHRFGTAYGREPTVESLRLKKPNAHYLERAMADLGVGNALFVGDNESDVRAAHNAGLDSAFIRRPHRVGYDLDVEPTHDVADLHELRSVCT